ncbi:MAG TPA: glycosyltransferase [Pyrinomonadaceae bacterium]|jgi:cellulose synthase/poly-beta-1,6-N-acetylglucosamine synthase-like glycosyltransferase
MWVFYFFAALLIWQGIASLIGGVAFFNYVRREMNAARPAFAPFASVIAPCRGLDQGLRDNLDALFRQDYPAYEIIFVTDSADDPALAVVEEVSRAWKQEARARSRVLIAGKATESGQKVHNLRAAVGQVDSLSEILVFVDTDARPRTHWLSSLVAPLADEGIGATTGYRWFIPARGGLATHLRSVWNASIASALGARGEKNFCWGGSTAIRLATFQKLNMLERWRGTLSDDFTLMRSLRRAQLPIHFVPACLTASLEDCGFRELLEFTTRQLKITRVYAPQFWKAVLVGSLLFVFVFFGGLALVATRAMLGQTYAAPLALICLIYALGIAKAALRWRAVSLPLNAYRARLRKSLAAHLLLWPLASVIYLYNALCAAFSRRINWRGITYELKSPTETVIIEAVSNQ